MKTRRILVNPRLVIFLLVLVSHGLAETRTHQRPDLASPIGIPLTDGSTSEACKQTPCAPGCPQIVTCQDYDTSADTCTNKDLVLVDWRCEEPCSCAADQTVACHVSYRCIDMAAEIETIRRQVKANIKMKIPYSRYKPDNARTNDE